MIGFTANPLLVNGNMAAAIYDTLGRYASIAAIAQAAPAHAHGPGATVKIEHSSGQFDFLRVDARRNRLLAAHGKDETEDVIDLKSRRVLARLKVGGAVDTPDPESWRPPAP